VACAIAVAAAFSPVFIPSADAATLVWSDEFSGDGGYPAAADWTYDTGGGGWGNSELEYYTSRRDALANAFIEDGCLVIEARRESTGGYAYTSARIKSVAAWTYGRVIVRAKLPAGDGNWPAIWMMPKDSVYGSWPASGEIDIMEHLGSAEGVIHGSLHTEAKNHVLGNNDQTATRTVSTATSAFHEYRMDWTPQAVWMYVDDDLYFYCANPTLSGELSGSAYWPFDQPFYVILNVAMGGWGGDVDNSALPARMLVDYVRVYSLDEGDSGMSRYDGVTQSGWSANGLLGPLYVSFDPWVWSEDLSGWLYAPQPPRQSGEWIYVPRPVAK
jgi:licheninase